MAMAHDPDRTLTPRRTAGHGIVTAGDRTGSVKRARRHSQMVRLLRIGMPLACLALAGLYGASLLRSSGLVNALPSLKLPRITPENLTMDNPRYDGFSKDGGSYTFTSKTAQQDFANPTLIKLNAITGTIYEADKTRTDVAAATGTFNQKTSILELFKEITVSSESGLKARLTHAVIRTKDNTLTTKQPVLVEFPAGTIRSKSMRLRQKEKKISFVELVEARLKPATKAQAADAAAPQPAQKPQASLFAASDAPIDITANRLDVNDLTKLAVFTSNVKAVQGDQTMTTPELKVSYDAGPEGEAKPAEPAGSGGIAAAAGKVRRIVAAGPVVMTRGETDRVMSQSADFDAANETGILAGNVVMTSGIDRMATSDRADLDQKAETIVLSGNVVVTQGKTEIRGRRLLVDRMAGKSQLTAPPGAGAGPGRITAHFDRGAEDAKGKDKAKAAAKGAAKDAAQPAGGLAMANFKTDPKAPLDVEADQLDVNDATRTAVFRGAVKAAQGDFVINAAELTANYSGSAGLADVGATQKKPEPKKGQDKSEEKGTEITKIVARRDVVVTGGEGQTVTGDWAEFDAKSNMVTVGGNVTLTQGQNSIQGSRLVIDMTTGESTIDAAPSNTVAIPGGGGWLTQSNDQNSGPGTKGRPSAVFFPQQAKEAMDAKKQAKKDAGGGWETKTDSKAAPAAN